MSTDQQWAGRAVLRTCRCGCGGIPRSARSEFLRGHHWRQVPEGPGRHLTVVRERSLCACNCGEQVIEAGSRFRPGHHTRTVEWKTQFSATRGKREARPWHLDERRRSKPWNTLQDRIAQHLAQSGGNLSSFERELGIHQKALSRWFRRKGKNTKRRNLERIADVLGISVEDAIREAGGTSEDQRAEHARRTTTAYRASMTPRELRELDRKRGRKIGRALSGKPKSPEHVSNVQAARAASRGKERSDAARLKASKAIKMRVIHSMGARLMVARRMNRAPTPEAVRQWIHDVSATMRRKYPQEGITAATLIPRYLGPFMKKHGLRIKVGRPPVDRRRRTEIEQLMTDWPRDRRGDLVNGFWPAALSKIQDLEGDEAPKSKESLRQWWLDQAVTHA